MEFNKKGILGRAKEAAQQSTAVTDEESPKFQQICLNQNYKNSVGYLRKMI